MSLPRFFLENQVIANQLDEVFPLDLASDDVKHAKVLRLKPGEHIAIIDADKDYFECEIVSFDSQLCVSITQHESALPERASVILLQGLCKGEKMDDVIRHATELGVSGFIPLKCERSIVKLDQKKTASRMNRWNSIAKSAAMQSGQPDVPFVHEPCTPAQAVASLENPTAVIVCWEEERSTSLKAAIQDALASTGTSPEKAVIVLAVGPEGGFSEREVEMMKEAGFNSYSVTLGPSILRTETAGIVAPALAIYELGGLQ